MPSNLGSFVKRLRDIMRNDAGINGDAQRIEQISWLLFLKVYDSKEEDWEFSDDSYKSAIPEPCRWRNWAHDENGHGMTGQALLSFVNQTLFPTLQNIHVDTDTPIREAIVQSTFAEAHNFMQDGVLLRQVVNVIDSLNLSDYEESHAFGEIYESILKELQSAGSAGEFYTPRGVTEFMAKMVNPQIGQTMADFACGTGGFITSWLKELRKEVKTTADEDAWSNSIYGMEKKQFPYMLCVTNMLLHDIDDPKVYHGNSLTKKLLDYTDRDKFDCILMNPPYGGSEKNDVKSYFPDNLASSETADLFMAVIMYRLKGNGKAAVVLPDGFLFGNDTAKLNLKKKLLNDFNLHTIIRMPGSVFSPYTSIATNILFFDNKPSEGKVWFYRMDMPEGVKHFNKTRPIKTEDFAPVTEWWNGRKEIQDIDTETYKSKCFTTEELANLNYDLDQCGFPTVKKEILSPEDTIMTFIEKRNILNEKLDKQLNEILTLMGVQRDNNL